MISHLEGKIIFNGRDFVIIDVQGIGYKVFLSDKTLSKLSENKGQLKLYTHLRLKEDTIELYGFLPHEELELFETLNNISGIGPKTALALSSFGSLLKLKDALEKSPERVTKDVKGIGQKRLQKIILEVTGHLRKLEQEETGIGRNDEDEEAVETLISLGFTKNQAKSALSRLPKEITVTEQKVKEALKLLGRG